MSDRINPKATGDVPTGDEDPGFSREEAEDWLNEVPLFESSPEESQSE